MGDFGIVDGTVIRIDVALRDAYLSRLGLEAEPPSVDALQRLHRSQVERIPYETMWIQAGERWGVDPVDSAVGRARPADGDGCVIEPANSRSGAEKG